MTTLSVSAVGAAGGDNIHNTLGVSGRGGDGGKVVALLPVTPGETLQINVGGAGQDGVQTTSGTGGYNGGANGGTGAGWAGGGGGGASDVRQGGTSLADRVIVAGGGGGGATNYANGGNGGQSGTSGTTNFSASGPAAGGGATQSGGGEGGIQCGGGGADGDAGLGGEGGGPAAGTYSKGGGGGGGYFGGGGGDGANASAPPGSCIFTGGGGGGSSLGPADSTFTTGFAGATEVTLRPVETQTITFPALANAKLSGTAPVPAATASSGLPVQYSSQTTGTCQASMSGAITLIAAGTCTIAANQPGDSQYGPAPEVTQSFQVLGKGGGGLGAAQKAAGECVISSGKIPRRGSKSLMLPVCKTNAGQRIGVRVKHLGLIGTRGDVRYFQLACKSTTAKKRTWSTVKQTKSGAICPAGVMKIRTLGYKQSLRVIWSAPRTAAYKAFRVSKTYRM